MVPAEISVATSSMGRVFQISGPSLIPERLRPCWKYVVGLLACGTADRCSSATNRPLKEIRSAVSISVLLAELKVLQTPSKSDEPSGGDPPLGVLLIKMPEELLLLAYQWPTSVTMFLQTETARTYLTVTEPAILTISAFTVNLLAHNDDGLQ